MKLYFDCKSGISGDMSVGALIDLGADTDKLEKALKSMNLDNEFKYVISKKTVNSIMTTDFDVILPEHNKEIHTANQAENNSNHCENHHEHRNLDDINRIINQTEISESAKIYAKKICKFI